MKFYCYFRFSSPFLPFPFAFLSHSCPLGTSSFAWTFFLAILLYFLQSSWPKKKRNSSAASQEIRASCSRESCICFPLCIIFPWEPWTVFLSSYITPPSIYRHRYQLRPSLFYSPSNGLHLTTDGRIRRYLVISRYGYDFSWRNVFLFSRENSIFRCI